MARYIDIEGYRKLFDEEYKKTRGLISEGETHLDNIAEGFSEASRVLDRIPTADVVPKSEEGAECPTCHGTGRIGTTNWLTKNMTKKQIAEEKAKAIAEHEQHIKAEVAREIFEDIEKLFSAPEMPLGVIPCLASKEYEDFKKKYTEDQSDG